MKYIRTFKYNEDSLFEVIEEFEETVKCKLTNCENGYLILSKEDIIQQADTIEELCDEFVYKRDFSNKYNISLLSYKELCLDFKEHKSYDVIYAAIWTSKGLIYVAKMNEDGELELI